MLTKKTRYHYKPSHDISKELSRFRWAQIFFFFKFRCSQCDFESYLCSYKYIQFDRRGRRSRSERRDMKNKRDTRYKTKRASIWTFEKSQMWLSDIVFKLGILEINIFFFFTLKLQGAGVIAYWQLWMQLNSMTHSYGQIHRLTLFALGRLKVKAPELIDLLIHVSYLRDM